jgi:hypothetical protein
MIVLFLGSSLKSHAFGLEKIEYSKNGKAPHSLDFLVSQIEKITNTDQFIVDQ